MPKFNKEGDFNISRREFLKIGTMGALGFLAEIGIPAKARAELEKLLDKKEFISSDFGEGIRILQDNVWNKTDECMMLYVEKGAKKGWIDVGENSSEEDVLSIDLAPIFDDESIDKLLVAHTHPSALYKNKKFDYFDPAVTENILKNKKSDLPIPPGSTDIISSIIIKNLLKEKNNTKTELSHMVVEPSGIWEYGAKIDHPGASRLYALYEEGDIRGSIQLYEELREWRIKFSKNLKDINEHISKFQNWAHEKYGLTLSYNTDR